MRRLMPRELMQLVQERQDARASKNFARADEIRDELQAMGVVLKDQGGQTVWEIA